MRATVILLMISLWPASLVGQTRDDRSGPPSRRLSFVLELGPSFGGPSSGLADQLRVAGFDDTDPGGCFLIGCSGPTTHPTRESPGTAGGVAARFAISRQLVVGASYGNTSLGGSSGYRADTTALFGGRHIFSHWDATFFWAGAFWKPAPILRVGGGPGWYRLESISAGSEVSQLGLMVEAGLELPADRRFFLDLAIRGHFIPAKDVEHGSAEPITLRPEWSHATLLAGLGFRL